MCVCLCYSYWEVNAETRKTAGTRLTSSDLSARHSQALKPQKFTRTSTSLSSFKHTSTLLDKSSKVCSPLHLQVVGI